MLTVAGLGLEWYGMAQLCIEPIGQPEYDLLVLAIIPQPDTLMQS